MPWGAVSQLVNGYAGSGVNAQETYIYNKRLEPWTIDVGTTANAAADYCLVYNYYSSWTLPSSCPATSAVAPSGTTDNGSVMAYWYNDGSRPVSSHTGTYSYDSLNRLWGAVAKDFSNNTFWSQTYSYDRWGNMSCSGTGLCTSMSYSSSNNNQLASVGGASVSYDAAGNLTQDLSAPHTYQWDAEGRMRSIDSGTTASITFNALGQRVYRSTPSNSVSYWYDPAGRFLGGYGSGWWNAAIPFAGRLLAEYASGTPAPVYFDHPNMLGSEQQWTDSGGNPAGEVLFYPWGAKWGDTTNGNLYQLFASLLWYDPETDGYQAAFRYDIPRLGRWLTPDPVGGDVSNPESLNRYGYALNSPCSLVDPLGLQGCSFNIAVNNGGISQSQLNALERRLENLFTGAHVGVNFNFSGPADYTLNVVAAAPPSASGIVSDALGATPMLPNNTVANYGFAAIGQTATYYGLYGGSSALGVALGGIGAHEAGHYLLQIGREHLGVPYGIMASDAALHIFDPGIGFTPGEVTQLQYRCGLLHPFAAGGGGDTGFYDMWMFLIPPWPWEAPVDEGGPMGIGVGYSLWGAAWAKYKPPHVT
jgi:RHS repeat-associated protein